MGNLTGKLQSYQTDLIYDLSSCLPHPFHGGRETNIVGLKLVKSVCDCQTASQKSPFQTLADLGYTVIGEVVDDARPGRVSR